MPSNLERIREDLARLRKLGGQHLIELAIEAGADWAEDTKKEAVQEGNWTDGVSFRLSYQKWYTEARAVVEQLVPYRLADFDAYYKNERRRGDVTFATYTLSDYLVGLTVVDGLGKPRFDVDKAAFSLFSQQHQILQAAASRFDSAVHEIRSILQADLFDSELDAARELIKVGFVRPGGVMAGVVLEAHLGAVAETHAIKFRKRSPAISDFNDALKDKRVIDVPMWRFIQRLGDLRNLAAHAKDREPTAEEASELVDGTDRVVKTVL